MLQFLLQKWMCLLLLPLLSLAWSPVRAQQQVKGKVTSETGESLPGVTVLIKGTAAGTTTDAGGQFTIQASAPTDVLVFSFIGFQKKEVLLSNQTTLEVKLTPDVQALNEVVVTALGIKREVKALTYSQQGVNVNSLNETRSPNIINSLSGKIAGVQVVPSGFNTGSARIVIRGNNSLTGNNQPLFVVDGVPIDNTPGDNGAIDYGNTASDINAEDIESMQVLKGPNASALYGSRAANGVILIITKKGSSRFKVSFNSSAMFQKLTEFPEYQNAYGVGTSFYIDRNNVIPRANVNYRSWGSPMMGQPYLALDGQVKPYLPQPDNVQDFYSTAHLLTNSVAVEGGNSSAIYRLSYTNYTGTSVVKGFNENNKHSINLRLQNTLSKRLSFDTKINYVRDMVRNRQYSNANGRNPTNLYTHMARSTDLDELTPYKDEATGQEIGTHRNFSNPYWVINENPNRDVKDRVLGSFNAELELTSWLKFIGRLGTDLYWWDGFEFNNIGSVVSGNPNGFMQTFNTKQQNLNLEGLFAMDKKLGNFSLVATLGANSFRTGWEKREQRVNSLLQPGLINLSNAREFPVVGQGIRKKQLNSVYGSLSLGYNNYAFLDVTGRNDWSSTLPAANNAYFYPSVGTTVILTELMGLQSHVLSFAKIRGSYAMVGSDTDPYRLNQTFSFNGFLNGAPLASLSTTRNNPTLKPEKTTSREVGLDLRLFRDRIALEATRYWAATTNQIITAQLPASSGYRQRVFNAGKIKNWGYETSVTGKIIKSQRFNWESRLNFSRNQSRVVELLDGIPRFQLNNNSSYLYVFAEVGKPYGYLRGLGVKRDAQGRMLIEKGGSLLVKDTDMAFGTANPDWLAGFQNTFSLGPFDLGLLIDIKAGGKLYSGTMSRMLTNGVAAETLYGRDAYYRSTVIWGESGSEVTGGPVWDAYTADGEQNTQVVSPQNYEYSRPNYAEFVIYDASFVKLRELTFGYNFPDKILAGTPVKTARVSLAGRNLALLYRNTPRGIDPEASSTSGNGQGIENGSLPPNAMYGMNIRLTF